MVGTPGDLGPAHRRRRTSLASPCAVSARLPPRSVRQQLASLPTQTQVVGGRHIPEEPCHRTIDRTGYTQLPLTTKPYRDGDDPYAFRIELPAFGSGTSQVVFSRGPAGQITAMHLGVQPLSFRKRPGIQNPRPWAAGALAGGALAIAVAGRPRHERAGSD